MNQMEREAIILNLAWEMIDPMVTWAMFVKNDRAQSTNPLFQTSGHARLSSAYGTISCPASVRSKGERCRSD
jgi:hypothetical protein